MKRLVVLISGTLLCIAGMAANKSEAWIMTGNERIKCEKVNVGINKVRVKLENGMKKIIPMNEIESYSVDGVVFDKKMLYRKGKATGRKEFMQLVNSRGDLSLYRTSKFDAYQNEEMEIYNVYKGDDLYLALEDTKIPARLINKTVNGVFNFFNVR